MKPFWYLATPYSKYPGGIHVAFTMACIAKGKFLENGVCVFSPIVHSHPVAVACGFDPLDHAIWLPDDEPMMVAAFGLIVYEAQTWQDSYGIAHEIEHFQRAGKPVLQFNPGGSIQQFLTTLHAAEQVGAL